MSLLGKQFRLILLLVIAAAFFMLSTGTAMAVTADEPIAGYSMVTAAQLEAELSSVNPSHIHPDIAQLYVDWGNRFGIKADLAFAQMLNETGYLRYGGDVQPWQNNFAGIGATGGGNPGNSFATPELGVIAHYAHLAWYVFPNHVNDYCNSAYDPRHFGSTHINSVRTLRDLGGRWAVPGTTYGDDLARIATRIWGPSDPDYTSYPVIGDIRVKWYSLNRAPGSALQVEYPVNDINGAWIGQAQDFYNGRLIWDRLTRGTFWVHGAIVAKYDELGREASLLGMPTSDEFGIPGGRAQNFANGRIYWSAATGAHEMHGEILTKYVQAGGPSVIGYPTTDEQDVSEISGARENRFPQGRIYWTDSARAHEIHGAIFARFLAAGGLTSLGLPTTDEISSGPFGGRESRSEAQRIYWSFAGGAHMMEGAVLAKFLNAGGPTVLGVPVTDLYGVPGVANAQECDLQAGRIYTSAAGTFEVHGAILAKYLAAGGPAWFGVPTSDEQDPGISGVFARYNTFQFANVYWSPETSAHVVYSQIMSGYTAQGGPSGFLGLPITDTTPIYAAGATGALRSTFQGGHVYAADGAGAHEVHGAILAKYLAAGGPGWFGVPASDETTVPGADAAARMSQFRFANVYWSPSTSVHIIYGAILTKFVAMGAAPFGLPVTDLFSVPGVAGAQECDLERGRLYNSTNLVIGAHEVHGAILAKYLSFGGPSWCGVPTSDELDAIPGVLAKYNTFQYANFYWSPATDTHEVHGAIRDKYLAAPPGGAGGPAGSLGLPTTDEYYAGGWTYRNDFQHGNITWTPAGGTLVGS